MSDVQLSAAEFRALYDRVKRMSRWGTADQRGALNNLAPMQVTAAAKQVRRGRTVSLAAPIDIQVALDDLVAVCEELDRWSFLCVIAPLRLRAGTGSPVNPIAIF